MADSSTDTLHQKRSTRRLLRVLGIGLAITAVVSLFARRADRRREQVAFANRAQVSGRHFSNELVAPIEVVHALGSLFEASQNVSEQEYETFARPALERNATLSALLWVPRVTHAQRAAFEAERKQQRPGFEITELNAERKVIRSPEYPVYYPADYATTRTPFKYRGLSFPSTDIRFEWLEECLRSRRIFVTPRHVLIGGDPAVSAFVPVYAPGAGKDATIDQARGVVVAIFAMDTLIATSLPNSVASKAESDDAITVVLRDDSAPKDEQLLYSNTPHEALISEWHGHWSGAVPVGRQTWQLSLHTKERIGTHFPTMVMLLGVFISLCAAALLWFRQRLRRLREEAQTLGQYALIEKLGEGGMGAVYRAQHSLLRRPTAIKLIHPEVGNEGSQLQFEKEVQAAADLTHPNSITVYDYGRTPDGILYYAMEYIPGINLHDLVTRYGPLPTSRAIHFLKQVCGALIEAHARGLVHRDVKPANMMVCVRGEHYDSIKVLDFGLVLRRGEKRTEKRTFLGTPHYMAPEQITDSDNVGPAADVYALGCVAFFLLTGTTVFHAETLEQVSKKHISLEAPNVSERSAQTISKALATLLASCLAKAPEERPAATELLIALDGCENAAVRWSQQQAMQWWQTNQDCIPETASGPPSMPPMSIDVQSRRPSVVPSQPLPQRLSLSK